MRALAACAALTLALAAPSTGCYAVARPDARLRPGFEVGASGGVIESPSGRTVDCVGPSCDDSSRHGERREWLYQLHLQYAWGSRPGGAALAVAVDVPVSLALPYLGTDASRWSRATQARVDLFAALCHRGDWHCGAGLEASAVPGAYLVLTRVLGGGFALSLTGRYLRNLIENGPLDDQAVQAQLAASLRLGPVRADVFASYTYANGLGVDLGDPENAGADRHVDWSQHLVVVGTTLAY
jgi:hypothetical protein